MISPLLEREALIRFVFLSSPFRYTALYLVNIAMAYPFFIIYLLNKRDVAVLFTAVFVFDFLVFDVFLRALLVDVHHIIFNSDHNFRRYI